MSLTVEDSAVKRIQDLRAEKGDPALMLRVTVEGGGCSGFQYKMVLSADVTDEDLRFGEGDCVVTDPVSLPFLDGSTVRFKDELIGSEFVIDNPNAQSGCGCGSSFSV